MSPLISTRDAIASRVGSTRRSPAGPTVLAGGIVDADGVLRPTVLTDVTPEMKVCASEVFGPVVGIAAYDDLDEALRLANDSDFGLQAAIFTSDIGKALEGRPRRSTTAACWSTRCRRGVPISSHTAACATAATPARALRSASRR